MKTWSTDPPNSYDAPNPGTAMVGFEMVVPANSRADINVTLIPGGKKVKKKTLPLNDWE